MLFPYRLRFNDFNLGSLYNNVYILFVELGCKLLPINTNSNDSNFCIFAIGYRISN